MHGKRFQATFDYRLGSGPLKLVHFIEKRVIVHQHNVVVSRVLKQVHSNNLPGCGWHWMVHKWLLLLPRLVFLAHTAIFYHLLDVILHCKPVESFFSMMECLLVVFFFNMMECPLVLMDFIPVRPICL